MTQAPEQPPPSAEQLRLVEQLSVIFMPGAARRRQEMRGTNDYGRFVHYTSAKNALSIIQSRFVWMRNARCMADYREIDHGFDALRRYFATPLYKGHFFTTLNNCIPGIADEAIALFDQWLNDARFNTYITSLSEHDNSEDRHGRLSMWRAFSRASPSVALVIKLPLILTAAQSLSLTLSPVAYYTDEELKAELFAVGQNVYGNNALVRSAGRDVVLNMIFAMLLSGILSLKHEGFKEEREWRVIYSPTRAASPLLTSTIETIDGVPQTIYKIPLSGPPPADLERYDIPHMLDRIIIGPTQYAVPITEAFATALADAGVPEPHFRIVWSGIPIRT